jgi:hypothetical protein
VTGLVAVLVLLAVVSFAVGAFPMSARINFVAAGLAFLAAGVWMVPALDAAL